MQPVSYCLLCQKPLQGSPTLQLGNLPPCNRFEALAKTVSTVYPISVLECQACGLIQLVNPPPVEALVPRVPWIKYNEPDAHLEAVSAKLLKRLQHNSSVYGVGPFDQPLMKSLLAKGLSCETLNLLTAEETKQKQYFPYLETLQACLGPGHLGKIAVEKGRRDLVLCRYLLEHCRDPLQALIGLRSLVTERGFALLEVPDSTKFLMQQDYSFIWEEHVCYFTESSFTKLLHRSGYKLIELLKFEGQLEDALVAIVQPLSAPLAAELAEGPQTLNLFAHYAAAFEKIGMAYRQALAAIQARGGKVAIFGAGHQAVMFMNALGLNEHISCLVDDDLNKQDYFSPGRGLPIISSAALLADAQIDTCLLAVSPRLEAKIQEKCAAFLQRGGKMYSIFPGSKMGNLLEQSICA